MNAINLNAIGIPLFLGSILLEIIISSFKKVNIYNWKDTLANITVGLAGLFVGISTKGIAILCYQFGFEHQLFSIENTFLYWAALYFLNDVSFYSFHRLGHESRFFWSAHVNHHSSEEFNLSTAVRTPFMFALYRYLFWTPLAFMGFEPLDIVFMNSLCMMYQFFLHTKWMKKWGVLEYILNTPSHHRVHHSSNPQYIDKNYGGSLIIWDRMFGTFAEEKETPVYGITKNINTYNPVKIVFHEFADMMRDAVRTRSVTGFFKTIFGRPGAVVTPSPLTLKKPILVVILLLTVVLVNGQHTFPTKPLAVPPPYHVQLLPAALHHPKGDGMRKTNLLSFFHESNALYLCFLPKFKYEKAGDPFRFDGHFYLSYRFGGPTP